MRIGVITHPLHLNYGGILQAYALQRVLQDMGHDVVYIDWMNYKFQSVPIKTYLTRFVWKLKWLGRRQINIFGEKKYDRVYNKISKFAKSNITIYSIDSFSQLREDDFDAIVVGSDQIWRPIYILNIEDVYLRFAEEWNIKRIAYAASFGVDDWSEYSDEQTAVCRRLAQKFDAISVREDSGVDLCRGYLGVDAQHVLDPTMLVNVEHYMRHINSCKCSYPDNMCLAYILDETDEKSQVLDSIANHCGYRVKQWKNIDKPSMKRPTVEEWLKGFYDAEFVFTDSFHGCVFAIIFNKPFIAFGNEGRGMARFNSLLRMFGLEELLITTINQFSPQKIDDAKAIFSSDRVQSRLYELRKHSYEFLQNALS